MESADSIDQLLDELYEFGRREGGMWNLGPTGAGLLAWLIGLIDAKRVLEIGTSNGVSAIWMSRALRETGGELITLELEPFKVEMATENLRRAGLSDIVTIIQGPAIASMQALGGTFDLVFIDADKPQYPDYLREARRLVHSGSVIAADNVSLDNETSAPYRTALEEDAGLVSIPREIPHSLWLTRVL